MGGRASDLAGSDFMHPFEYDPNTNTWTTKSATYNQSPRQVNNMACGVLTESGTPYIYCVGGSAATLTMATARVFRYNPVTDTIQVLDSGDNWPGNTQAQSAWWVCGDFNKLYILGGFNNPPTGLDRPDLGVYSHGQRLGAEECTPASCARLYTDHHHR